MRKSNSDFCALCIILSPIFTYGVDAAIFECLLELVGTKGFSFPVPLKNNIPVPPDVDS